MYRTSCLAITAALLSLSAAACNDSDDGGPEPTPMTREDYDDVAQSVGKVVVTGNAGGGEVASISDSVDIALGATPFGFSISAEGEINGSRAGLTYRYDASCRDAAGAELESCTDLTDTAAISVAWAGDVALPNFEASIDRTGDWAITGLQSDVAVFTGSSDFELDAEVTSLFRPVTSTFHLAYSAEYDNIRVDTDSREILDGEVHYAIDAERTRSGDGTDVEATFVVDADLIFDAGTVTLVLDGDQSYQVNIETGDVNRI